jgi:hypothetical protein
MFTARLGWFGAETRRQQSGRMPGRMGFALRLENLEGRATPGGLVSADHIGEEIPQTVDAYQPVAVSSDVAISGQTIQVDPTMVPAGHGGETVVGVDLNGGSVVGSDFLYGVQVDPTAVATGHGGETVVGVDLNGGRGGISGEV